MRVGRDLRVELCAEHGEYRPALNYVDVTTYDGGTVAMATNGFLLGVVPVDMEDGDLPGLVHWSAFAHARKISRKKDGYARMILGEHEVRFADGWSAPRRVHSEAKVPDLKFPDISVILGRARVESQPVFGLNPRFLITAGEAVGYEVGRMPLYIHRDSPTGPLLIATSYQHGAPVPPFAMLMPLHLHDVPALEKPAPAEAKPRRKRTAA